VIRSKPRAEAVARLNLERQGYRVYFPRIERSVRIRGRWTDRIEPLFPRYLFLNLDVGAQSLGPVRSTVGVTQIVRFGADYAAVPEEIVSELMRREDPGTGLHRLQRPVFAPGDAVRVLEGPFHGLEGVFECQDGGERVLILLELLGRGARVRLPLAQVAPMAACW
jgi:transcriptional antiterminator RfaH